DCISNPIKLVGLLCHELCHAALPSGTGHGRLFIQLGREMLLEGKPRSMQGGDAFQVLWARAVAKLGKFPGARISEAVRNRDRPNRARKLKVECDTCDITFRLSQCHWDSCGGTARCINANCIGYMQIAD